jgi:hypothetical protein
MNETLPPDAIMFLIGLICILIAGASIGGLKLINWTKRHTPAETSAGVVNTHNTTQQINTINTTVDASDNAIVLRDWMNYVNAQPNRVPHLAVIGPSGAGKTTLVTAVLSDRVGDIVVLTAKEGDSWGGLEYIGIDDDATYNTMHTTFDALYQEVKQRLVDTKHDRMNSDWLTIVVDDFSTLVKECPVAADVVKLVARLGRSLRVRLVMLSDSALVKAIGLEGEGETRSNFAFVRLRRGHKGAIEIDGRLHPIEMGALDTIAKRANLTHRSWGASVCLSEPAVIQFPHQEADRQQTDNRQTATDREAIAIALIRDGKNRDEVRAMFRRMGWGLDNNDYTRYLEQANMVAA